MAEYEKLVRDVLKKALINWLGLLGIVSFLSYAAAVVFSPLAYPNYDWLSQAVSDLSAANAPSLTLWNRLSSLYGLCGIVCVMMVCVAIQGKLLSREPPGFCDYECHTTPSSCAKSQDPCLWDGFYD